MYKNFHYLNFIDEIEIFFKVTINYVQNFIWKVLILLFTGF